jgi:hypothetical protein
MKKRLLGPVAVVTAVLVVTGMVLTGVALARTSRPASSIILTIRLHEVATNFTYVPIKPLIGSKKQYNQGDYWAGDDALKNMSGVTVGRDEYVCFYTNINKWEEICPDYVSTFTGAGGVAAGTIYDGSLFFSPPSGPGQTTVVPILRGTGAYAGAQGSYTFKQITPQLLSETINLTKL